MVIEVWSDMVCPFCYIGKRRLEKALKRLGPDAGAAEVIYRSFQLDPSQKSYAGRDIHAVLAEKYGYSYEQARRMNLSLARQAGEDGLIYNMDSAIPAGTRDAHRLCHWAKEQNRQAEMEERVMKAYFTDSLDIADHATLARLAGEIGLDEKRALEVLKSSRYLEEVLYDQAQAERLGIRGVPHFIIGGRVQISGAQPVSVFTDALKKAGAAVPTTFRGTK